MVINKDKKIRLQQSLIDSLIQENKELRIKLAEAEDSSYDVLAENNYERSKKLIEELESYIAEYEQLITGLKGKKEEYSKAIKEVTNIKVEYNKKMKEFMRDITREVK
jgi:hypothetical protein